MQNAMAKKIHRVDRRERLPKGGCSSSFITKNSFTAIGQLEGRKSWPGDSLPVSKLLSVFAFSSPNMSEM